jgi:hypothetical protein
MSHYANANLGITRISAGWDDFSHQWNQFIRRHGNPTAQRQTRKFALVALFLCACEFSFGWVLASQVISRAAVGCVCFMGFSQVLPPNLALSEAQRFAIWDLL